MSDVLSNPGYQGVVSTVQPRIVLNQVKGAASLVFVGQFVCKDNSPNCRQSIRNGTIVDYYVYDMTYHPYPDPYTLDWNSLDVTGTVDPHCFSDLDRFGQALQRFGIVSSKPYPQTSEVYWTDSRYGLMRHNFLDWYCRAITPLKPVGFNRTLTGAASGPGSTLAMVYGGIDTASTTMAQTLSSELMVLNMTDNTWVANITIANLGLPAVYSPMLFVGASLDNINNNNSNSSSSSSTLDTFYMMGGCTNVAVSGDPTDETGCLPWDTLYVLEGGHITMSRSPVISPIVSRAIKVNVTNGATIPPTTRSPCFTYIPSRKGLFVSGGNTKSGTGSALQHWLLEFATMTWSPITITQLKPEAPLPTNNHACMFLTDQVIFAGPINANFFQEGPPVWPIRVSNNTNIWTKDLKVTDNPDYMYPIVKKNPTPDGPYKVCGNSDSDSCGFYYLFVSGIVLACVLPLCCLVCCIWRCQKRKAKKMKRLAEMELATRPALETDAQAHEARVLAAVADGDDVLGTFGDDSKDFHVLPKYEPPTRSSRERVQ